MSKYLNDSPLWRQKDWTYTKYWCIKSDLEPKTLKKKESDENGPDIEYPLRAVGNKPIDRLEWDEYRSDDEYTYFQNSLGEMVKVNTNFVKLFKNTKAEFYSESGSRYTAEYNPVQVIKEQNGYKQLIGLIMPVRI